MAVEASNKPSVAIIADGFENDTMSAASSRGIPGLRYVVENIPGECTVPEKIEAGINAKVMDGIVSALTTPLTEKEKSPRMEAEQLPRIAFKGSLEEVNRFFYKRGWTDGLPVIPPTEEAVREMLTGTDLPPDHVVVELIPRLGKATVEKIAVNAVMAGALPTYMPLLIAGVEILADPDSYFGLYGVSTGSWAPYWIVNGPVRRDVDVYGGGGALSPGHIANATIGRALGLIIKNIGGVRPQMEDMGVHGNPCKYSMVVGENEEDSPWEPLHVERGFNREDSTITLSFPKSYIQALSYKASAQGALDTVVNTIPPSTGGMLVMSVNPTYAKYLADEGWTKPKIRQYIKENACCPAEKHWYHTFNQLFDQLKPYVEGKKDVWPLILGEDQIAVIVSGKNSSYIALALGPFSPVERFVTRKANLPANWEKLVKKYKDVKPTYARY